MGDGNSAMSSIKLNNTNIRSNFIKDLISSNPSKYFPHSDHPNRIKKSSAATAGDFISDTKDVVSSAGQEVNDVKIIPPGRKDNPSAKSDKFETAWVSISNFNDFPVVLASMGGRGKTSNIFKEGMVCFFSQTSKEYSPVIKKSAKNPDEYYKLIESIIFDIEENGIPFMRESDKNEILQFIKTKSDEYDLELLNSIQNSMSIGNWIRNSEFSNWEIRIDDVMKKIKREASLILKIPSDKWNPMDIVAIKPGKSDEIFRRISEAKNKKTKAGKLDSINSLFCEDLDNLDSDCLAIAISLKEETAQHGKAKSYLDSLESVSTEYNLTEEEKKMNGDSDLIKSKIISLREEIMKKAEEGGNYLYKLSGEPNEVECENLMGKFASFKMLSFLIDKNKELDGNIFRDLASYGLSMGLNPCFFKAIGNKNGKWEEVSRSITKFPKEGSVEMYDSKNNDYDGKIWILDSIKNSGIKLVYWVIFSNYIYNIHILLRSNQPSSKVSQATIEITDFKKMKEL